MHAKMLLSPCFPMSLRERIVRLKQLAVMEIAWSLPRCLVYWVVIRGTAATAGDYRNPLDVSAVEVIEHFEP
jgi:hypothetical protein